MKFSTFSFIAGFFYITSIALTRKTADFTKTAYAIPIKTFSANPLAEDDKEAEILIQSFSRG